MYTSVVKSEVLFYASEVLLNDEQFLFDVYSINRSGTALFYFGEFANDPTFMKAAHTKRFWKLVKWAVQVRPYALHWLEMQAMRQEEARIESVAADPTYDPMEGCMNGVNSCKKQKLNCSPIIK